MSTTYTLALIGKPLGDAKTGVIKRVSFQLTGTDGTFSSVQSGTVDLPPIDPLSPKFIPLEKITLEVMLSWASVVLNLPALIALIAADIAAQAQAAALAPLTLTQAVADQASAGVPI